MSVKWAHVRTYCKTGVCMSVVCANMSVLVLVCCVPSCPTFGFRWGHETQPDLLLQLFLALPASLPSQLLLFLLGQIHTQSDTRHVCVHWREKNKHKQN